MLSPVGLLLASCMPCGGGHLRRLLIHPKGVNCIPVQSRKRPESEAFTQQEGSRGAAPKGGKRQAVRYLKMAPRASCRWGTGIVSGRRSDQARQDVDNLSSFVSSTTIRSAGPLPLRSGSSTRIECSAPHSRQCAYHRSTSAWGGKRERRWFVSKRPRRDTNGGSETEVTGTSQQQAKAERATIPPCLGSPRKGSQLPLDLHDDMMVRETDDV